VHRLGSRGLNADYEPTRAKRCEIGRSKIALLGGVEEVVFKTLLKGGKEANLMTFFMVGSKDGLWGLPIEVDEFSPPVFFIGLPELNFKLIRTFDGQWEGFNEFSFVENQAPRAQGFDLSQNVGGKDDGTFLRGFADELSKLFDLVGV